MGSTTVNNDGHQKKSWMFWRRKRHLLTFLAFLGFVKVYLLKVSVGVAVVAMTSPYNTTLDNGTVVEGRDFDWDSKMQGVFLSSYFYGQVSSQLFGGWLGARVGGARLFGWCIGVTALLTTITPPVAFANFYLLLLTRAVKGFFEGMAYPCIQEILAKWAPSQERATMVGIVFSGIPIGTVIGFQTVGLIADYLGWTFIFYITGLLGVLWSVVWLLVVKDRPEFDPNISPEELKFIHDGIGITTDNEKVNYPWIKLCTSVPIWAVTVAIFCENWGHITFITQLPTFMKDVYDLRLSKSGAIMSLPYIVQGIAMQLTGRLADWLLNEKILTQTQIRRLFGSGTFFLQGAVLMLSTQLTSVSGVILCLIILLGSQSFLAPILPKNCLDLSPQHASVIFGLCLTLGSTPGIFSSLVSGFIVTDKSKEQWQIVFYIATTLYVFGGIFYGVFSSNELQPWALDGTPLPVKDHVNSKKPTNNDDRKEINGGQVL
uniref:Major facilitator superfamily (MFS) profile domain-containing protein n=2 Tax=Graphocephala atropunctata TaxID=36148 RepID=A0A1B6MQK2_9HEMI